MSEVITIKECRACNFKKIINILSLDNLYLSDFLTSDKKTKKFPLELVLCTNCSLLQLKHTVPKEILYTERYGYRSGINQTMKRELKEIVEKAYGRVKSKIAERIVAVDIGTNDGTLLSFYPKSVIRVGIEPIKKFANECKNFADFVINDFFDYSSFAKKLKGKKAHVVTAISCFYDIHNLNEFLSDVKKMLHKDGVFIVQQNYLALMLEQNAFDNIVHEHLSYQSLLSLENLLKRHNLTVFKVELSSVNGGSFRTYICHDKEKRVDKSVLKLREFEANLGLGKKEIYQEFAKKIKETRKKIYTFIKEKNKEGKTIYCYGASTRGNTLLQVCMLDKRLIKAAVERNKEKWGMKIASLGIPIISEEQARKDSPDYMLVLPWFFKKEFIKREQEYLKNGGHFIFPLPKLEIV